MVINWIKNVKSPRATRQTKFFNVLNDKRQIPTWNTSNKKLQFLELKTSNSRVEYIKQNASLFWTTNVKFPSEIRQQNNSNIRQVWGVIRLTQFVNTIRLILRNSLLIFSLYVITHNVYLCLVRIYKEQNSQLRT